MSEKKDDNLDVSDIDSLDSTDTVSSERRKAISKLAYASPLLVSVLFASKAKAFDPPDPPGSP